MIIHRKILLTLIFTIASFFFIGSAKAEANNYDQYEYPDTVTISSVTYNLKEDYPYIYRYQECGNSNILLTFSQSKLTYDNTGNYSYLRFDESKQNHVIVLQYTKDTYTTYTSRLITNNTDSWYLRLYNFKFYSSNTDLYYTDGTLFYSAKPTISFSKTDFGVTIDNNYYITSVDLTISFSTIDNENYIYRYKKVNMDSYTTLTLVNNKYYKVNFSENDSIIVEILDIETNELVTSATYTISSISEFVNEDKTIDITFKYVDKNVNEFLYNSSVLYVPAENKYYTLSKFYYIYFSKVDFNKYKYEYSVDNGQTWLSTDNGLKITNSYFIHQFLKNGDGIIVRVINIDDNSINNVKNYTIGGIDDLTSLGQQIIFNPFYSDTSPIVTIKTSFVNFDSNNYNYYYQIYTNDEAESSLINITSDIICDDLNSYCYYNNIEIFNKGSVKVVINDKEGNYVTSATYTVDYYKHIEQLTSDNNKTFISSLKNALSYFVNPISEIFKYITLFFESLPFALQYVFIACFILLIALFIFKFII